MIALTDRIVYGGSAAYFCAEHVADYGGHLGGFRANGWLVKDGVRVEDAVLVTQCEASSDLVEWSYTQRDLWTEHMMDKLAALEFAHALRANGHDAMVRRALHTAQGADLDAVQRAARAHFVKTTEGGGGFFHERQPGQADADLRGLLMSGFAQRWFIL